MKRKCVPNVKTLLAIKELDSGKGKKSSLKEFKTFLESFAE